jgi:arylsulfatase A-like enzyme
MMGISQGVGTPVPRRPRTIKDNRPYQQIRMPREIKRCQLLAIIVFLLSLAGCTEKSNEVTEPRPNFIFLVADDQRWDAMGVVQREFQEEGKIARFPWFKTPAMDRMAEEGVRFRNAFVTHSLCSPSRAAFLTGKYNHANGIINNRTALPLNAVTHATLLREAGYRTAYFGKWHMGKQKERPGFDHYASFIGQGKYPDCTFMVDGVETSSTGWVDDVSTDFAIEWIKENHSSPFSVVIGFKSPHSRRGGENLPPRLRHLYEGETSRPTPNFGVPPIYRKPPKSGKPHPGLAANDIHLDFLRHVKGVDENLGRVLDALDELGLSENTVVVYTSDNGYFLGEHCLGDKRLLYEESLRIPFLVRYPRQFPQGQIIDEMILNIDLTPTLLELAGVDCPPGIQGASWKELARGEKPTNWRTSFLAQYYKELGDGPTCVAIRTTNAKLIRYPGHPEWTEAFDLAKDPYEIQNLANDTEFVAPLSQALNSMMEQVGYDFPGKPLADGTKPFTTLTGKVPKMDFSMPSVGDKAQPATK